MKRLVPIVLCLLAWFCVAGAPARAAAAADPANPPPNATPKEIELGKKAADEFEKDKTTKLLDSASSPEAKALLDKLNLMAKRLGAASARPGIEYVVKVVEKDDINAFTLPNGRIYMYRGLLDFTASDDEIAGVIGHEIGHNARLHALRGQAKAKKLSWAGLAAMAAMLAGGRSGADIGQFSQYLLLAVMNGYGIEYEKEADAAAVPMMNKAGYNPSAIVTFMQRLQLQEQRRPEVHLGIFQTHPPSDERAAACLAEIRRLGFEFSPRSVTGAKNVQVQEKDDRFALTIEDVTLLELSKKDNSAKARADSAAQQISSLLRDNLQMYELTVTGDARLLGRGQEIAAARPLDAQLQGKTPQAVAQSWTENFRRLFWKERLNNKF